MVYAGLAYLIMDNKCVCITPHTMFVKGRLSSYPLEIEYWIEFDEFEKKTALDL